MQMASSMEGIVSCLKEIIDQNGPSYPEDEPYGVYTKLTESGVDGEEPIYDKRSHP